MPKNKDSIGKNKENSKKRVYSGIFRYTLIFRGILDNKYMYVKFF
jgi:hypothetical protein